MSDKFAVFDVFDGFFKFVNQSGVAGEQLDIFVGGDEPADGSREVDQQRGVSHVVSGDFTFVLFHGIQVAFALFPENRDPDQEIPEYVCPVFYEHAVYGAHVKPGKIDFLPNIRNLPIPDPNTSDKKPECSPVPIPGRNKEQSLPNV